MSLREGFTTGSAATGAALAALYFLRTGNAPGEVRVPLPPFTPCAARGGQERPAGWLRLPVAVCGPGPAPELARTPASGPGGLFSGMNAAHASILKDGGDDPDVTSGALVSATVVEESAGGQGRAPDTAAAPPPLLPGRPLPVLPLPVLIEGGPGVGRVTLPGLPVPVGEAAINPTPRAQICFALRRLAGELAGEPAGAAGGPCPPLRVIVSVPDGERLALRTFNPRLGIEGGISILGTQGTVRPFSHSAWKATIEQGLNVAAATGCRTICLSTGRRSERLLMDRHPRLSPRCFIQAADFAEFSLRKAGAMAFDRLIWGCFFGKLVKLAQGHPYTHARDAELDMRALAGRCRRRDAACADAVAVCVTAAHALELLLDDPAGTDVLRDVAGEAARVALGFAGRPVRLHLFHTDGRELLAL